MTQADKGFTVQSTTNAKLHNPGPQVRMMKPQPFQLQCEMGGKSKKEFRAKVSAPEEQVQDDVTRLLETSQFTANCLRLGCFPDLFLKWRILSSTPNSAATSMPFMITRKGRCIYNGGGDDCNKASRRNRTNVANIICINL